MSKNILLIQSLFVSVLIFVNGVSAKSTHSCLTRDSNLVSEIEKTKSKYSRMYETALNLRSSAKRRLTLCVDVSDAGFVDLAEKICFGDFINVSELTTNQEIVLRLYQASIDMRNLNFVSSMQNADLALELTEVQILTVRKNADAYKPLNYFKYRALSDKLINGSYMELSSSDLFNIDSEIQKVLPTLPSSYCFQAEYLDNALGIFPEHFEKLVTKYSVDPDSNPCLVEIQEAINNHGIITDDKSASDQAIQQHENLAKDLEEKCELGSLVGVLNNLARAKLESNFDEALEHIKKVEFIASVTGELSAQAEIHWIRALREAIKGEYDAATYFFDSACSEVEYANEVDYKEIFGDFSFLNPTNNGLVSKAYQDSSCSEQ